MPPVSLWEQYSVVGILILAAGVVAVGFYRLWHELLDWFDKQDAKRELEREKQRIWQSEQDKIRDLRWQEFLQSMQDGWIAQDGRHTETIQDLVKKIELLIEEVRNHDTWTRAKG